MNKELKIDDKILGLNHPVYIVAEMSANHNQSFEQAVKILEAAKSSGADAVKLQTYTPDTMTIDCKNKYFKIRGTIWEGKNLYDLYGDAYTPWDWQPKLKSIANKLGLGFFSTPFDPTAVDFLEEMNVPTHKISSLEIVDLPLLRKIAQTGKPIIMSTGMATLAEIDEAVQTLRDAGNTQLILLKCTSAYPSAPEDMNLNTIPHLADAFNTLVGLSDHTLGIAASVAAVALGACIIEKHFTLSRSEGGLDSAFSLEPNEFKAMVEAVHIAKRAMGEVHYGTSQGDANSRVYRRSLFVVRDMKAGEVLTPDNIRSIRPAYGLSPKYVKDIIGKTVKMDIKKGTPMDWKYVL